MGKSLSVEQKFTKIMVELREIRPFYSAVYEVMEKIKDNSIETMGVTTDKLVYNYGFVEKCDMEELRFIVLHEIAHVALMHVARRDGRDRLLWNIACDFYVNSVLSVEFGYLMPGREIKLSGRSIKMPKEVLYCSSIDIDVDYVEGIYEYLYEQANENGYNSGAGTENKREFTFKMVGSIESKVEMGIVGDEYTEVEITINKDNPMDLIDKGEDQSEKLDKANKIVTDATIRNEMLNSGVGNNDGVTESLIKRQMNSQLNWKKLLRRYLKSATSKDSSFNIPDKRMYYQKAVYPGSCSDDSIGIAGVKVCIDTSGSISDEDLAEFMGQVWSLCKAFKVSAELIYWDTMIERTAEFTGYDEFERVGVFGRGGTNPAVVFDYLSSKECKIKPIVTLMFTDGYFGNEYNTNKNKRMFKDTIWIMNKEYNTGFEPGFGKLALAKYK